MASAAAISRTPGGAGPTESEAACGWRCHEHSDRVAELFCRRCRCCVCALCPVLGSHRGHPVRLALDEAAHVQVWTRGALGTGMGVGEEPGSNGRGGTCPGSNCQFPLDLETQRRLGDHLDR